MLSTTSATRSLSTSSYRVLLVDACDSLREAAARCLQLLGYEVAEAADAREAMSLVEKPGNVFHLLMSEVELPRVDGRVLADMLCARSPEMSVVLTSGGEPLLRIRDQPFGEGYALLAKPYGLAELDCTLKAALGQAGSH